MPKVIIVILQFNNSLDTIRCLDSVKELDYPNYEVIIVDNGSDVNPERSREGAQHASASYGINHLQAIQNWIKEAGNFNTRYKILDTRYNLGYSGGNNIGIKKALASGTDYILILNNDTTVEKNLLTKLVEAGAPDSQVGILGPAIDEGSRTIYGGKINWLRPELSHLAVQPPSLLSSSATKYYTPGAALLIKREVIEKVGPLDEKYFLYFEDADYCLRAQKAGYKLKTVPEVLVHHRPSSSTVALGVPLLLRYHYRNSHLFNFKNGPIWVKLTLPFWSVFIIIKQLAKLLAGHNKEISRAIMAGVWDFYRGRFGRISNE